MLANASSVICDVRETERVKEENITDVRETERVKEENITDAQSVIKS